MYPAEVENTDKLARAFVVSISSQRMCNYEHPLLQHLILSDPCFERHFFFRKKFKMSQKSP